MSKKILIINVSPRAESVTKKMSQAFSDGAISAGHEVVTFDAGHKNIRGCSACNHCWSKGDACIIDDDFIELSHLLEQNNVLLISTPLYAFGFPAQIKAALDRLYSYSVADSPRKLGIKESYMFVCGGVDEKKYYEPIIQSYKISAEFLGWKDMGIIQTCQSQAESTFSRARELGRNV